MNKREKSMNIAFLMKGKQSTYKKKNLYIYIYRQKEKAGKIGTKKRG